jgi:AmmeMemoRadiSam system protein A
VIITVGVLPKLLHLARARVEARVLGAAPVEQARDLALALCAGSFVTLRVGNELRGCVGRIESDTPLDRLVERMAELALLDERFADRRVRPEDLARLRIEVSVLDVPVDVGGPDEIVPGLHGVVVSAGGKTGCFLPEVAFERGWSSTRLLDELCRHKLDLPSGSWRLPDARIAIFGVESLEEEPRDLTSGPPPRTLRR